MTKYTARAFARFVLLGFVLIGVGYGIAALTMPVPAPSPSHSSRLVCATGEIANAPNALCNLVRR